MVIIAFTLAVSAQTPQKMSYQVVVRNNSGALVVNQAVGMKISILQGSATGTVVYSETYSPNPQTNANGLVTVEIGGGTPSAGNFSGINWGAGTYYLKTETDPSGGTSYTITGTSQLLSVPYAMHAKTVESLAAETDPVFNASPAKGITVGNITNWNTAYGWGNHSGLYRPVSWVPSWADVTGKPAFATVATSGSYNDLTNRPALFSGAWADITGKPTTLAGYGITDADNSNTNEIQTLSLSGTQLSLSLGGGTVTLPTSGGGDNWGTQLVVTDATLAGNGTTATPLRIADNGVTSAKIADGAVATADLAENSVTSEKIVDGTIVSTDLANNSVTTDKLGNASVTSAKLADMGAATGQVLKYDGSKWMPGTDMELTIPYVHAAINDDFLFLIHNAGKGYGIVGTSEGGQGILGESRSRTGVGVRGWNTADNGQTYGVLGNSISTSGTGVYGLAPANSGITYGIFGESASNQGRGVWGHTSAASGITYAVAGRAASTEGRGVFGDATATSGTNFGVYGKTASPQGYAGYFEGRMHVSGNVGIGTTEPMSDLHVYGIGLFKGTDAGIYIAPFEGGPNIGFIEANGRESFGNITLLRGKTILRGDVGIETSPVYKLDIAGGMNLNKGITSGVAIRCNGAEALLYNGTYFSFGFGNSGNYSVFGRKVSIGTTNDPGDHHLVVNGTAAKPGGGSWATWSDERLKNIHEVYSKGLSEIVELKPVSFSYKKNNAANLPDDREYAGLVAQEVQEVFPEAVTIGRDGYLQLDMHPFNIALINAVKELKAENDRLKSENEQINSRIARLEEILSNITLISR